MQEKSLPDIMDLIKAKAEARNPLHSHRIQLLKEKKTSTHSDFLQKLERILEVCEWAKMTQDQLLIHLFVASADQSMSKIAMEILSGNNPTVAALHTKSVDSRMTSSLTYVRAQLRV